MLREYESSLKMQKASGLQTPMKGLVESSYNHGILFDSERVIEQRGSEFKLHTTMLCI